MTRTMALCALCGMTLVVRACHRTRHQLALPPPPQPPPPPLACATPRAPRRDRPRPMSTSYEPKYQVKVPNKAKYQSKVPSNRFYLFVVLNTAGYVRKTVLSSYCFATLLCLVLCFCVVTARKICDFGLVCRDGQGTREETDRRSAGHRACDKRARLARRT